MFTIVSQAGFALLVWGNFYLPIYKLTGSLYLNLLLYLPRWAFDSGKAGLLPELFLYIGWQRPEKCSWQYPYPYFKKYTILFQGRGMINIKKTRADWTPCGRVLSSARLDTSLLPELLLLMPEGIMRPDVHGIMRAYGHS